MNIENIYITNMTMDFPDDFFEEVGEGEDRMENLKEKCERLKRFFDYPIYDKEARIKFLFVCLRLYICYKDVIVQRPRIISIILDKLEEIERNYEKLTETQKEIYYNAKNTFVRS